MHFASVVKTRVGLARLRPTTSPGFLSPSSRETQVGHTIAPGSIRGFDLTPEPVISDTPLRALIEAEFFVHHSDPAF
jgi:hypothetical protein